jgi:hypothetical protein
LPVLAGLSLCAPSGPVIATVIDDREFRDGCELLRKGDEYASERYVFFSDFNRRAIVNIGGRDVGLKLVRSKESGTGLKPGDRSHFRYASGGVEQDRGSRPLRDLRLLWMPG